jgi:hypothetical protein
LYFAANDLDQFMQRLFAGVRDDYRGIFPQTLYNLLTLQGPTVEPAVAVRAIHGMWSLGDDELSEEIYEALASFNGDSRGEFMGALTRFLVPPDNLDSDEDSFRSQASYVTHSVETATTASLTNSVGASTMDGDVSSLTSAGGASATTNTVHSIVYDTEVRPSLALSHTGNENRDENQTDIRHRFGPVENQMQNDEEVEGGSAVGPPSDASDTAESTN